MAQEQVALIPVDSITISEENVRKTVRDESVRELAESIRSEGLLQPVVVTPTENGYELIIGQRRFLAVKSLGWDSVPAVILPRREARERLLASLTENVQREDLPPSERARAVVRLVEHYGSYEEVARRLGYSEGTIRRWTALHGLWPELKEYVDAGRLTDQEALQLMRAPLSREQAVEVAKEIMGLPADVRRRAIAIARQGRASQAKQIVSQARQRRVRSFTIRMHEAVVAALERAANEEGTSPEELAMDVIQDWLREKKFLPR
jgi:ParB family chromosome partitioning protein